MYDLKVGKLASWQPPLGEDDDEMFAGDDSDMELEENTVLPSPQKTAKSEKPAKSEAKSGKFHHRLATDKDTETHSKVLEALANITQNKNKNKSNIEEDEESDVEESDDSEGK